jgi:short-subunit dehydrogenase
VSTTLVTGASSGIGAEFARQLSARGHHVTLLARREQQLRDIADELGNADVVTCDLTDAGAVAALPERIGRPVDYLVSNAGFGTGYAFVDSDLEAELRQVRLLCEATVHLCGLFVPAMVRRGSGTVVVVASTAGMQPLPYSAGYSAAKAHALTFAEALHEEVRASGVVVTALCPGPVRTEFFEKSDHPVERLPRPLWVDTPTVVRAGIDGAASGKRVVVPGALIRVGVTGGRYVPRWVTNRVIGRVFG